METPAGSRKAAADRRAAIARAARALIAEKGFEGLRTRDIAALVGINIATLHYHVPTKDALVALVAESVGEAFAARHQAGTRDGVTGAGRLRAEFDAFVQLTETHPELLGVMAEFDQRARRDPEVRAVLDRMRGRWLAAIVNTLALGIRDGSFRRDLDPAVGGAMVIATLTGASRTPGTTPDLMRAICAELERALRNPAAA